MQCDNTFFGFPHWWQYVTLGPNCEVQLTLPNDIWAIGLAILGMLLYLAGIAAVVSIVIAGAGFITSGGNAEKAAGARRRVINSVIGLVIALIATVTVTFVGNSLGGQAVSSSNQLPNVQADASQLQNLLNLGLVIIGGLAVLFIVISGLKYITAGGDPAKTASARSQLLYSVIGLVVAGSAAVIVNFVLNL